ncbi:MAG: PEGA domain-containing protein [Deltaproteobacteria bacterium]|nr:PEGA domain-containing protein [Deltaproteobacteria bacterium]
MRKAQAAILSDPAYKEALGCSVGEEVPPNSLLQVSVEGDHLSLKLSSIEKGCLIESASAPWTGDREQVGRAVATLVGKLRKGVDLPEAQEAMSSVQSSVILSPLDLGDDGSQIKNPAREDKGYLFVDSEPKGARIIINGKEVGVAPYQEELMVGEYTIIGRHSTNLYKPGKHVVRLDGKGQKLTIKLAPSFGVLKVESEPPSLIAFAGE